MSVLLCDRSECSPPVVPMDRKISSSSDVIRKVGSSKAAEVDICSLTVLTAAVRLRRLLAAEEHLLEARVPVVLDAVVGPPGQVRGDEGPPAADGGVERADDVVLLRGEAAVTEARAEVVEPPQAAALAAPQQAGLPRQLDPAAAGAVLLHVGPEPRVLIRRPRPALHRRLVAARRSPHCRALACR